AADHRMSRRRRRVLARQPEVLPGDTVADDRGRASFDQGGARGRRPPPGDRRPRRAAVATAAALPGPAGRAAGILPGVPAARHATAADGAGKRGALSEEPGDPCTAA